MKKTLKILILFIFIQGFGQTENDSIPKKSEFIELSVITDLCKDNSNWKEKKECSKQEILKKIRKELNYDIIEKLTTNKKYRIWYSFWFDSKGKLTKTLVRTDNDLLKTEFKRIIDKLELDFDLQDEKGNLKNGRFDLPVIIETQI
ncbi:hypothetical protein ACFQ1R_12310 [Mariniflexile jejuense]|uniref:TonB-like protein n=1 Tax=Mariniflexile jejuense TaxID=1173582 RepID=A0ABW3JK62_9FLAO